MTGIEAYRQARTQGADKYEAIMVYLLTDPEKYQKALALQCMAREFDGLSCDAVIYVASIMNQFRLWCCDECRLKNEWPADYSVIYGKCEMCGSSSFCHDLTFIG